MSDKPVQEAKKDDAFEPVRVELRKILEDAHRDGFNDGFRSGNRNGLSRAKLLIAITMGKISIEEREKFAPIVEQLDAEIDASADAAVKETRDMKSRK